MTDWPIAKQEKEWNKLFTNRSVYKGETGETVGGKGVKVWAKAG